MYVPYQSWMRDATLHPTSTGLHACIMALTNTQVEQLMERRKRITQALQWKPREDRTGYQMEAAVGFHDSESDAWELGRFLALAVPGKRVRCALMYASIPIRRLCDNKRHTNPAPDRSRFDSFHKHKWDETDNQRWAYIPQDLVTSSYLEHPDDAVRDFLEECGIELLAGHQRMLL